jgi:hypothetical protein
MQFIVRFQTMSRIVAAGAFGLLLTMKFQRRGGSSASPTCKTGSGDLDICPLEQVSAMV